MSEHVSVEVRGLIKPFSTNFTLIKLLACMGSHVFTHILFTCKSFAALLTLERFFTSMCPLMVMKIT